MIFVFPFKVMCSPTVGWICAPGLKCMSQMQLCSALGAAWGRHLWFGGGNLCLFGGAGGTWCLEGGSLSHTPARASQRNTRPHRRSPRTQTELWYGKGRILTSPQSPQICRKGWQEKKQKTKKCQLLKQRPTKTRGLFSILFLTP